MATGAVRTRPWFPAFLLLALILGTFAYLVLIAILPFLFGPWALLLAALIAAEILVAHRRHRRRARTSSRIVWGLPVKGSAVRRPRDQIEAWVVGTFLLIAFAVVVWSVGAWLRATAFGSTLDLPWYIVGTVLVRLAIAILFGFGAWGLGARMGPGVPTQSELFDTTEDH